MTSGLFHGSRQDTPKGSIAWLLWGGDAGAAWAASTVKGLKS